MTEHESTGTDPQSSLPAGTVPPEQPPLPPPGPSPRPVPPASPFQPLYFALVLLLGILLGLGLARQAAVPGMGMRPGGALWEVLDQIQRSYVDSVTREELERAAVEAMLAQLDPHSTYFSAEEMAAMAEPMEGNFEGIGVEFIIQDDVLRVWDAIAGGPAERAGIRAGDHILKVDGEPIGGPELTNAEVMKRLKGPGGSEVELVLRRGDREFEVRLVRDKIPIYSVVAALPLSETIGYVKVIRFAQTTDDEFQSAMEKLAAAGNRKVIVDLRSNGGGYLQQVVPMVASFLDKGEMVVYTEGRMSPRRVYKATENGRWRDWEIAVLIDENSASASEIFAGAIQDLDRGVVVGRRSFGKGLVQEEFGLENAGALRLTIARFHTPTGRAIQKPYGAEAIHGYEDDWDTRYASGELFYEDSIPRPDSLRFVTPAGREVFGGGGIAPDVFVPLDTTVTSVYLSELSWTGLIRSAAFDWVDKKRASWGADGSPQLTNPIPRAALQEAMAGLTALAEREGIQKPILSPAAQAHLERELWGEVIRAAQGEEAYYAFRIQSDPFVTRGRELLRRSNELRVVDGRLSLPEGNR